MFEDLYAPLPDRQRYLERIGADGPAVPDKNTLDRLILAHQRAVPFENLDVFDAGRDILLDTASLYDKIVGRRRGGYCFELNALFMSLLLDLGFDCFPIAVRVVWHLDCYMPVTHRAGVVQIGGKRYFCDVGFGGPQPGAALDLDDPAPQRAGADTFVFEKDDDGDTVLARLTADGRERLLKFSERPCRNVDFLAPNEYQSKNPNSGFKRARMLNLATDAGSVSITGDVLKIHHNGRVTEKTLETGEELTRALMEYFGLAVDIPLNP